MNSIPNNNYRYISWKTVSVVFIALLYVVIPFDIIPDVIPLLKLGDDVAVLVWAFSSVTKKS
jgi:uncharacterized membrane protein YkvA (DUF1232 family)